MSPQMTYLKSFNGRFCKEVEGCTQASRRLSDLISPPTCLFKEVETKFFETETDTFSRYQIFRTLKNGKSLERREVSKVDRKFRKC